MVLCKYIKYGFVGRFFVSKGWKITISIISSILGLILIFLGVYYLFPWNKSFFDSASVEFAIPGLDTKFTPQGLTTIDGTDKFLVCGYMTDDSASRLYLINDGKIEKYFTLTLNDEDYKGHAGGVCSKGGTIWIVGDKICYRFWLSDVNNCENAGKVEIIDCFETSNGADFVFENDGYLYIGEFYRAGNYETIKSHWIKTRSGETNPALVLGYKIDESKSVGLYSTTPSRALSIRGLVQGIAVADDKILMSCSYGIADSKLYVYSNVFKEDTAVDYALGNHTIKLWYLDGESLKNDVTIPSMSEEITIKNGRVYILFESGAKKYKIFNRKQLKNVYSLALDNI